MITCRHKVLDTNKHYRVRYIAVDNRKLSKLIADLQRDSMDLKRVSDSAEAQMNHAIRSDIVAEISKSEKERVAAADERAEARNERQEV